MSEKPPRVPHADRPAVVKEFCTCVRVKAGEDERRITNPDCPLHGPNAERSPF